MVLHASTSRNLFTHDAVNSMLLNEFLKEQNKAQERQATIPGWSQLSLGNRRK
jgi:hypothetical protein